MSRILRSPRLDVAIALVLFVVGLLEIDASPAQRGTLAAGAVPLAGVCAAFAIRRRLPAVAAGLFLAALIPQRLWLTPPDELFVPFLGLLLIPYAAGAYGGPRTGVAATAACVAVVLIVALDTDDLLIGDFLFPSLFVVASFFAGRTVRSRTHLAAELHEAAVRAEEEHRTETLRAVAAERRRIAREMHDIVAHSISVMVVQAGGARRIMEQDAERSVEAAVHIERTGREALAEMRRLLGVLHGPDASAVRAPQPGLDGLAELVERARRAGLPVELRVEGERREVATGLDLAAYRIVQEALTNALKHAGASPTDVRLCWAEDELQIVVRDRGGHGQGHAVEGTGHGLIGMRERVRLYGGEMQAGPRSDGGFEVRARLPLDREEVTA